MDLATHQNLINGMSGIFPALRKPQGRDKDFLDYGSSVTHLMKVSPYIGQ